MLFLKKKNYGMYMNVLFKMIYTKMLLSGCKAQRGRNENQIKFLIIFI